MGDAPKPCRVRADSGKGYSVLRALRDEDDVRAAEREGIRHHCARLVDAFRDPCHVAHSASRIRLLQESGWRKDPTLEREQRRGEFERAGPTQQMAVQGFG